MSLQDRELDVRNRQRNLVFPDTNLNAGRFYRNIASGRAIFSRGQKFSLLVIMLFVLWVVSMELAFAIRAILSVRNSGIAVWEIWSCCCFLGILMFWIFLTVEGLFPEARPRRYRRGYRQSGRIRS
jgi:hypothetical protein